MHVEPSQFDAACLRLAEKYVSRMEEPDRNRSCRKYLRNIFNHLYNDSVIFAFGRLLQYLLCSFIVRIVFLDDVEEDVVFHKGSRL